MILKLNPQSTIRQMMREITAQNSPNPIPKIRIMFAKMFINNARQITMTLSLTFPNHAKIL